MGNPRIVRINGKCFEIDTSYTTAIECNQVALDRSIGDTERALAIIYKLYGEKGLNSCENYDKLLELAKKYLRAGGEEKELKSEPQEPDMDYVKDMPYIKVSFMSDYNIDLDSEQYKNMHWWTFYNLLNGLSNSELGNCCILNRIRNLRNMDLSKIKDIKERKKIEEMQQQFSLDYTTTEHTKQEEKSINEFYKSIGKERI